MSNPNQPSDPNNSAFASTSALAAAILQDINVPPNIIPTEVPTMVAWLNKEGGGFNNPDTYNGLNTTLNAYGGISTNSAGVKAYPTPTAGLDATVSTLEEPAYTSIVNDLRAGAPEATVSAAIAASPWGTGPIVGSSTTSTTGSNVTSAADQSIVSNLLDPFSFLTPTSWVNDLGTVFGTFDTDIKTFVLTSIFVVAGLGLVLFGMHSLAEETPAYQDAEQTAGDAGKVAAMGTMA